MVVCEGFGGALSEWSSEYMRKPRLILSQIVQADNSPRLIFGAGDRGEQQSGENRDDGHAISSSIKVKARREITSQSDSGKRDLFWKILNPDSNESRFARAVPHRLLPDEGPTASRLRVDVTTLPRCRISNVCRSRPLFSTIRTCLPSGVLKATFDNVEMVFEQCAPIRAARI